MSALARLEPLPRSTLWDSAYASLRTALMEGRLKPGQRIVLRDIADQLGISLTPVRDAVNRLVAERVLERGSVGQGGGATVPLLDADQFGQLMAVRSGLEPLAAEAALKHATPEQLDEIEDALHAMQRAAEKRPDAYLAEHHRFHFGIYALCRMPIVMEIIEGAWLRCAPTLTLTLPRAPDLKRYPLHLATMKALREGDGTAAAAAIRADIESARDDVCRLLEQRAGRQRATGRQAKARLADDPRPEGKHTAVRR
jgi:DNA-binding GntR family transcriptional regulator